MVSSLWRTVMDRWCHTTLILEKEKSIKSMIKYGVILHHQICKFSFIQRAWFRSRDTISMMDTLKSFRRFPHKGLLKLLPFAVLLRKKRRRRWISCSNAIYSITLIVFKIAISGGKRSMDVWVGGWVRVCVWMCMCVVGWLGVRVVVCMFGWIKIVPMYVWEGESMHGYANVLTGGVSELVSFWLVMTLALFLLDLNSDWIV